MYPLSILALGRLRLDPCQELSQHYLDMLRPFARLEVTELSEGRGEPARALKDEAARIRARLQGVACPVLLTPEGRLRDSETLARWLGARMDRGEGLAFVIGSSHGFDPTLKAEVREQISLSPLTFPHELSRVLLLEQLYRAFTILRGKAYHK